MHTYSFSNILAIFEMCWDFSDCLSLSLSFLFTLVVSMAPKHKSTPSWNSFRSRESSSSDPTPSSIRFCDEDARKDFSKNFSRRGVHSERRVILADFTDTDLPNLIHSRGWESNLGHGSWIQQLLPPVRLHLDLFHPYPLPPLLQAMCHSGTSWRSSHGCSP